MSKVPHILVSNDDGYLAPGLLALVNALELTGQAAGGLVKVTISGKYEMKRVQIDPAAMDDREMLEDLVVTAYTDAFKQAEAASQALMSGATAGMPMPPGFKLPF
ncbi:MAG: YbaB/EbfC family nucleoid-associated protein [Burkholderiaceae bacterium]|nr:YbaB/EbfC family nucleoid-associated protein [Burkholderiaceae bacterium]